MQRAVAKLQTWPELFFNFMILPPTENPVPFFFGLNFFGNHTIDSLEEITIHSAWKRTTIDINHRKPCG